MAKPSRRTRTSSFQSEIKITRTAGEIFADGSIIELTSSAVDDNLALLLWHRSQKTIAPQIKYRGRVYEAPHIDGTLLRAIHFPSDADDYGTARKLLAEVCNLFERYIGVAPPEAALVTAWSWSTWFPECVPSPPTLVISGPDMGHAMVLFRLLGCVCRRALVLADINRSGLLAVMCLQPTLLVNQPGQFPKVLCGTTNYQGVHVLSSQGKVHNLVGSRAFFVGMTDTWSDQALHFAVPAAHPELPSLDEQRQAEIARRFQPQLLMYRLRNLRKVHESHSKVLQLFPNTETARNLAACIQEEPDIAQAIAPILQRQDEDAHIQRGCDVNRAIVEVIWAPLHQTKEITTSRITQLTNALLRCRGEMLEYSAEEIGWQMRNLGLYRHRNGGGMVLRFSREHSLKIHELERRFALNLSRVRDCPNCGQPEVLSAQ